jgi:hypothetical protein
MVLVAPPAGTHVILCYVLEVFFKASTFMIKSYTRTCWILKLIIILLVFHGQVTRTCKVQVFVQNLIVNQFKIFLAFMETENSTRSQKSTVRGMLNPIHIHRLDLKYALICTKENLRIRYVHRGESLLRNQ